MYKRKNKMNVFQLTIITAINMMGSGIIMLPAKLARVGTMSILSWLVTVLGSMALAYSFAQCGMYSNKTGGMGGYAEYSFGKSGSFLSNYTYAVALVIANIAIAITAVGYATSFLGVSLSPVQVGIWTIITLWLSTVLNFKGAKVTGRIGSFTVWGVIAPILVLCVVGWFWFSKDLYAQSWNPNNLAFFEGISESISITLWCFLGLESASANMGAVENPKKNVPIACLGGTVGAAIIYILATNIIAGIIPNADLLNSNAPFGLVFSTIFNPAAGRIVMGLMVISCFGSLLGWQFTIAEVFRSSALEGYFPKIFSKLTRDNAPVVGMIIITIVQSLLALMTISPTLSKQFDILVNLSVVTNIVPYLLSMAAVDVILRNGKVQDNKRRVTNIIAFIASIFSLYALYSSGYEAIMGGALFTFAGWTLYGFISSKFDLIK
ncbi:putrescine-ornithine antiporter [Clostridium isatidis]|uniref:Putrescine transporter n=1 Tax=Clostridium isatidis TaxID=182773 RepID=A0A343JEK6_9CLOT|nr:putrescine-ornithine antiporter [Clostridium isatidis]ASW43964.1 putrescine-ornithine antiporter [Clostridium isatidis]